MAVAGQKKEGRADQIDQDNLVASESVGTFRWNDSLKLINVPRWKQEYAQLLPQLNGGWNSYAAERFQENIVDDHIQIEPHQLDGLSFPMTLVRLIALRLFYKHKKLNIIIMGGSAIVEERLFIKTNYYEELTNFYPEMKLSLYFVGPKQSVQNHNKTITKN